VSPAVRSALLLLAVALFAFPCAASAATVNSLGNELLYQGDLGEQSDAEVGLTPDGTQVDFVERGTNLQAGLGCSQVDTPAGSGKTGEVTCTVQGVAKVTFDMRDGDDSLTILPSAATAPPMDVLGGDGTDLVSYLPFGAGVSVSLDDKPNDGAAGRSDFIRADVENVNGSSAADVFTGSPGPNRFFGAAGADTYTGGAGDDFFDATEQTTPERDAISCGEGRDTVDADKLDSVGPDCEIVAVDSRVLLTNGADRFKAFRSQLSVFGRRGNDVITGFFEDRIDGGKGRDRLNGGDGADVLTGGPGRDKLFGGSGNDTLRARDGERDLVSCGKGKDRVTADRKDAVVSDCEKVSRPK
jgi:Ca2+-binding RTX toxin-like protein